VPKERFEGGCRAAKPDYKFNRMGNLMCVHRWLILFAMASLPLACVPRASAELSWASKTMTLQAAPGDTVLEARFRFTNSGAAPVDIRQISTSCACTAADLDQRHYEPGQSGEIVARYMIGTHAGLQQKLIAVSTSDRSQATILTLDVHIPQALKIAPAALTWEHGEEPKPKIIRVELAVPGRLSDLRAVSQNPAVTVLVRETAPGKRYELTVAPASTAIFCFASITINFQIDGKATGAAYATASVKPAPITD
jgi:hypothetical protein